MVWNEPTRVNLEAVLERSERECMFRNEWEMRAFVEVDNSRNERKHMTEWIVMGKEDDSSRRLCLLEEEARDKQELLYAELQKVRRARDQVRGASDDMEYAFSSIYWHA